MSLLKFSIDLKEKLSLLSKTEVEPLIELLQEPSHSFGLKCISDLEDKLCKELDLIHETKAFEYYFYEQEIPADELLKVIEKEINFKENRTLLLILDILEEIEKQEKIIGKIISRYLTDHIDDPSIQSFKPLNDLYYWIINELETKVYKDIHSDILGTDIYEDYLGWFYWFSFENEYGKKELSVEIKNKDIKIKNKDDFLNLICMLKYNSNV